MAKTSSQSVLTLAHYCDDSGARPAKGRYHEERFLVFVAASQDHLHIFSMILCPQKVAFQSTSPDVIDGDYPLTHSLKGMLAYGV
jgi:hypothetical protein